MTTRLGFDAVPAVDDEAALVAALLCVDPVGLGGVAWRGPAGAARDAWLDRVRGLMPASAPMRRVPLNIQDDRLLGGLDLAATLAAGRPIAQRGLLVETDGGIVILGMAERMAAGTAARIAATIDTQEVAMERDGLATRLPCRIGIVAFDEGIADDERLPDGLLDRLAFRLFRGSFAKPDTPPSMSSWTHDDVATARALLPTVQVSAAMSQAVCAAALALGVDSIRGSLLALRTARVAAALDGRSEVDEQDAALAARLVLGPRATTVPTDPQQAQEPEQPDQAPQGEPPQDDNQDSPEPPNDANEPQDQAEQQPTVETGTVEDVVLEAALAAIPAGLLDAAKMGRDIRSRAQSAGRSGASIQGTVRGRPGGVRRGEPRAGARLNVIETLRAAAPWQTIRKREAGIGQGASSRIQVRRDDFHVTRFKERRETTTVFVVDASGSSALHRLAEAKGAVELLLADCYVRRDSVALIAFRGRSAEVLLPPTRSLVRAKRSLAGLPGGGGTPLAAGIDATVALVDAVGRRGRTPVAVLLTDGRANIARDGGAGRPRATEDALQSAQQLRATGVSVLLLDTSPQPQEPARQLARAMGATYLALPHADAALMSSAVRLAGEGSSIGQRARPP